MHSSVRREQRQRCAKGVPSPISLRKSKDFNRKRTRRKSAEKFKLWHYPRFTAVEGVIYFGKIRPHPPSTTPPVLTLTARQEEVTGSQVLFYRSTQGNRRRALTEWTLRRRNRIRRACGRVPELVRLQCRLPNLASRLFHMRQSPTDFLRHFDRLARSKHNESKDQKKSHHQNHATLLPPSAFVLSAGFSAPLIAALKPRIPSPRPLPNSGSFFGPKTSNAIPTMTSKCIG